MKDTKTKRSIAIIALAFMSGAARPAVITYDGSATPDSPSLRFPFSWNVFSGTAWSAADGVLTMTTANNAGIWFGNELDYRPPPWRLADPNAGNAVAARVKLGLNSGQYECYLNDGTHQGRWEFNAGYVTYETSSNTVTYPLDTTGAFHDYAFHLHSGQVTYSVDGAEVFSGPAFAYDPGAKGPYFVIGDGSGSGGRGFGTLLIDEVTLVTEVDQPQATIRCSQVEVCWGSFTNKTYQVQYRSTLTTNLWADLGAPLQGSNDRTCVTDAVPPGEPQRFYRVVVQP